MSTPDDDEFDQALVKGAFVLAAAGGWSSVSVAAAARSAGVSLDRARLRFPGRAAILLKLGQMADRYALSEAADAGDTRERLFDMLMHRIDVLQQHRAGVLALLHALPGDPADALLLSLATSSSLGWMLEAAGVGARGFFGMLRIQGLGAVWLYTLRAWLKDDSADLSATMAALDRALQRAAQVAGWFRSGGAAEAGPKPFPDPSAPPADPSPVETITATLPLDQGPASPAAIDDQP